MAKEIDKSKIRHIIFDMDGTLIDTIPHLLDTYAEMNLEKFGISPELSREHFLDTMGIHLIDILKDLCAKHSITHMEHGLFLEEFREKIFTYPQITFDDVVPALERLSKKYTLAISSAPAEHVIEEKLTAAGVRKYFSVVLGHAADESYTKGPKHVEEFMKRKGLSKEDLSHVVYVGDARKDMEIAKFGGMIAVGRIGTFSAERLKEFGADLVINNLHELAEWLSVKEQIRDVL